MFEMLATEAQRLGKPEWRPMLRYVVELHRQSTHPAQAPFSLPWEEIGPGYVGHPAFGHWDIVHQILDSLPTEREHARNQILNNLENQQPDGFLPGVIWMPGERRGNPEPTWSTDTTHPPVWQVAVQDFRESHGDAAIVETCYEPLVRQIGWFERHRKADDGGFFYTDILNHSWESGVDEGVRFDEIKTGPFTCIDATAHVYWLYEYAARWAASLGREAAEWTGKAAALKSFIQEDLFDEETGFFHDIWAVGRPESRHLAFEGVWAMIVGAASPEQAARVIDENLLDPDRFFTPHPLSTVGRSDPSFELRMWRGPAWSSMTYWAARGCVAYGRADAARTILEKSLDASCAKFGETGTIWEFNHPLGGDPMEVKRKPGFDHPSPDYLGHNPLLAMARLWESTGP